MKTKCVVQMSGGVGSFLAAQRAIARFGQENVVLLFADTLIEDEDLYRFLDDSSAALGVPITRIADGRTPWEVFRDVRYLGNTRIDPCSKVLKRELLRKWIDDNCDPTSTVVALGIDWTESHRFERAAPRWLPWELWAPLCDEPLIDKADTPAALAALGIELPRLYKLGFPHNNCGGFCIKAGQAQFKLLHEKMPERYAECEAQEESLRSLLGDVAILRDRRGGTTKPLTLRRFREEYIGTSKVDADEWGGCGCAID